MSSHRISIRRKTMLLLPTIILVMAVLTVVVVFAARQRPIVLGQTEGFANGELVVFDYTDNFFCADEPLNADACDLGTPIDANNILGLDPADTPDLVVIIPFFDSDGDGTLEGLDPDPDVFVQCPETQSGVRGLFSHCILHDHRLDATPLGGLTVTTNAGPFTFPQDDPSTPGVNEGIIPLPNHTHIVSETPGGSVPWDTSAALVFDSGIWPDADGGCPAGAGCLTSMEAISDAVDAGTVVGPVPTTLFLFFGVRGLDP